MDEYRGRRARDETKFQAPSTKSQINPKFQIPMTKTKAFQASYLRFGHLVIGIWSLFEIWCLELGALVLPAHTPNKSNTAQICEWSQKIKGFLPL
jgi:hypothetical protein